MFVNKIKTVEASYRAIRRARGDGNCFFRSFVFAYMEQLVNLQDLPERNRSVYPLLYADSCRSSSYSLADLEGEMLMVYTALALQIGSAVRFLSLFAASLHLLLRCNGPQATVPCLSSKKTCLYK